MDRFATLPCLENTAGYRLYGLTPAPQGIPPVWFSDYVASTLQEMGHPLAGIQYTSSSGRTFCAFYVQSDALVDFFEKKTKREQPPSLKTRTLFSVDNGSPFSSDLRLQHPSVVAPTEVLSSSYPATTYCTALPQVPSLPLSPLSSSPGRSISFSDSQLVRIAEMQGNLGVRGTDGPSGVYANSLLVPVGDEELDDIILETGELQAEEQPSSE